MIYRFCFNKFWIISRAINKEVIATFKTDLQSLFFAERKISTHNLEGREQTTISIFSDRLNKCDVESKLPARCHSYTPKIADLSFTDHRLVLS